MATSPPHQNGFADVCGVLGAVCQQLGRPFAANELAGVWADLPERSPADRWTEGLVVLGEQAGLVVRSLQGKPAELLAVAAELGPVVVLPTGDESNAGKAPLAILGSVGRRFRVWDRSGPHLESRRRLAHRLGLDAAGPLVGYLLQAAPTSEVREGEVHAAAPVSPARRLLRMLRPDAHDLRTIAVFSLFVGGLSLATPLAVEAVVNTIAFGRYLQPLLVLSLMVFVFLVFRGALGILLAIVVEMLQRRLFVRTVDELAQRLIRVPYPYFRSHDGPELVNRFFDVMTIQKVVSQLLLDTLMLVLQTGIGLAVLAFYHPFLLGYDVGLLLFMTVVLYYVGRGAVRTSTRESNIKYRTAAWLQGLARNPLAFTVNGGEQLALRRADELATEYCQARRVHFRIVIGQVALSFFVQAIAGTLLLGMGGYLVISGQMTLGQLVAAELIVTVILGSFTKVGKHLESIYDLLAAVDKLGKLYDLPLHHSSRTRRLPAAGPAHLELLDLQIDESHPRLRGTVPAGSALAILGDSRGGESELLHVLCGQAAPHTGQVLIDRCRIEHIALDSVHQSIDYLNGIEMFEGTLDDNLRLGRVIATDQVDRVVQALGLAERLREFPDGLATAVHVSGDPLCRGDLVRLMLARSLAGNPRLLIIDGLLDLLADDDLPLVLAGLQRFKAETTFVIATGRRAVAAWADQTWLFSGPHADSSDKVGKIDKVHREDFVDFSEFSQGIDNDP